MDAAGEGLGRGLNSFPAEPPLKEKVEVRLEGILRFPYSWWVRSGVRAFLKEFSLVVSGFFWFLAENGISRWSHG